LVASMRRPRTWGSSAWTRYRTRFGSFASHRRRVRTFIGRVGPAGPHPPAHAARIFQRITTARRAHISRVAASAVTDSAALQDAHTASVASGSGFTTITDFTASSCSASRSTSRTTCRTRIPPTPIRTLPGTIHRTATGVTATETRRSSSRPAGRSRCPTVAATRGRRPSRPDTGP
jgi:hypothetical protein